MAAAIPAVMMAGAGVSAVGAISQANASAAASSYNASLREQDASVALDQANQDVVQVRRTALQSQGSALAEYGASGVSTDEGSPLDVLAMGAANAKMDEENVLYKGRLKASGYQGAAELERFSGDTAKQQGYIGAASYLVGGAGNAGYSYATTQRPFLYGDYT